MPWSPTGPETRTASPGRALAPLTCRPSAIHPTPLVLLNTQFYLFLSEKRGRLFALAAIPFHLLYHFYNGISFLAGALRYFWKTGRVFPGARPDKTRG